MYEERRKEQWTTNERTNINHFPTPPLILNFYFISEAYNNGVKMRKSAAAAHIANNSSDQEKWKV